VFAFVPRPPDKPLNGRVIRIYNAITDARGEIYAGRDLPAYQMQPEILLGETGGLSIVSINKGARDGLEPGHVLALSRDELVIRDRSVGPFLMGKERPPNVQLPEERIGLVMVFRVFDTVCYALTLGVERPVRRADVVAKP
jgi:hypothetical protein